MSNVTKKTTLPRGSIKSIKFDRLFPTDRFLNSRIGFEYELAPGESHECALDFLNSTAEEWWRANFPHMVGKAAEEPLDTSEDQTTMGGIQSAETLEGLRAYRSAAQSNYYLGIAYKAKHRELTQRSSSKMKADFKISVEYRQAVDAGDKEKMAQLEAIYDLKTDIV